MSNPIENACPMYKELNNIYNNTKDLGLRFQACYNLVNQSSYEDIHFSITALKEARFTDELNDILSSSGSDAIIETLSALFRLLKAYFAVDTAKRQAFLLDILEEARERKRPSIT